MCEIRVSSQRTQRMGGYRDPFNMTKFMNAKCDALLHCPEDLSVRPACFGNLQPNEILSSSGITLVAFQRQTLQLLPARKEDTVGMLFIRAPPASPAVA